MLKEIAEPDSKCKGKMNGHTARPCISRLPLLMGNQGESQNVAFALSSK